MFAWYGSCLPQRATYSITVNMQRLKDSLTLTVPKTNQVNYGDHAFEKVALVLWNSLQLRIRMESSLEKFKSSLKTYLFSIAYN